LNNVDGLKNIAEPTNARVASWTTADFQLTYQPSFIDGLRIALTAINVFDKEPPFVSSPLAQFNIGYDPTNSDPLGRFLTISFTKSW
jgi:iron complex outermembrane recepter protein